MDRVRRNCFGGYCHVSTQDFNPFGIFLVHAWDASTKHSPLTIAALEGKSSMVLMEIEKSLENAPCTA